MSTSSLSDEAANLYIVWEVEAHGRSRILEAKERRARRIKEARYLALTEIERIKEEKEKQFQAKCSALRKEDEKQKERIRSNVETELAQMEARVKLCKHLVIELLEILVVTAKYAIHRNVDARRWIAGIDKRATMPPNRRACDKNTWETLQLYVSKCETLASQMNLKKEDVTKK